jgi:ABC-type glycerol-3-phosphate transport system substrate-binding protein
MKRIGAVFTVCLLLVVMATQGCGGRDSQDDRVTITFWHSFVSSTIPALNQLIARFEEEHPHIRIRAQYIPTGDALIQRLVTSVQSRTAPDISWIRADYMEDLVRADAIYPMSHFIDGPNGFTAEEMEDFYPALLLSASWRGTLYSIPMEATNLGLLYNRDLFREAGLDPDRPPQTWDELREYSRRLTIDRTGNGRFDQVGFLVPIAPATGPQGPWMVWQFYPFLWQAGGSLINEDQSRVLFDSNAAVRALGFWQELYEMQNLRSFTNEPDVAFTSRQLAMALDGPWSLPRYPNLLRNIDWAVAPLPAGPSGRATVVGGEYLAVFKQSRVPDEAWTFIKWVTRPDIQAFWSEVSGYLPVRRSVLDIPEFQAYLETAPNFRVYVEQMEFGQAPPSIDFHGIQIGRNLAEALEQATVGRREPGAVLTNAAERSNTLLQRVTAER